MRPTRRAGLTLLEVVIVTAIVAVLVFFLARAIVTSAPNRARPTAVSRPIPELAPVITTDLPVRSAVWSCRTGAVSRPDRRPRPAHGHGHGAEASMPHLGPATKGPLVPP